MKETLKLQVNNKKVIVEHEYDNETGKPFKDQKGGTDELKKWLFEEIVYNNKKKGWQTYNNFECSFDWKIVEDDQKRIAEENANIQRVDAQVKGVKW